jgi:hypothetical protein
MNYLKCILKNFYEKACSSKNRILRLCHRRTIIDIYEKPR